MGRKNMPKARDTDVVIQQMGSEVLVYDLADNRAVCLNETSALIWQMCDGNKSVNEISMDLSKKLKSSVSEELVWLAIDQLKEERLIANTEELHDSFKGINRRDVIKKVGLASVIALPVISAMMAPSAIHAASGTGAFSGNATISGTGATSCGAGAQRTGARDAACNTQTRANCPSNGAVRQQTVCSYDAATDTSTFGCVCT